MRDILLTLIVFGSLPFILQRPYIGVLVWSWLGYMNPHRMTWGFAYEMPFAQIVAVTLLMAIFFNKEKYKFTVNSLVSIWLIFLVWMMVSTVFAFEMDSALTQLIKIYKIQLVTLITILLINSEKKLELLIWVITISIGYFTVKGGAFTLATGGGFRVYGPFGTYIEENNALAVATLMVIPLMAYMYKTVEPKWQKIGFGAAILLSSISVFGSQSRGAFLAIFCVGFFYWLKTKNKLLSGLGLILIIAAGLAFMPESWHERMGTITNYEEDLSAMGRINAWGYAINVANDRITGAGLQSWNAANFLVYAPDPTMFHVAHSIYFSVLGDHGWPGLIMFLLIFYTCWRYLGRIIKMTKGEEALANQNLLAKMLQVSLIAYLSGGAFLSLSYFDLPWHLVAITVVLGTITEAKLKAKREPEDIPHALSH